MTKENSTIIIGKVSALEKQPSTIDYFYFWTKADVILNPFDVVVVDHIEESKTYGVIEEISHITDSVSFLGEFISNDFGDLEIEPPTKRVGMNYVKAKVVGNNKNIYIPVHNGSYVHLGAREDIQIALGLNRGKNSLVCGYVEMYGANQENKIELPVYVNSDFLVGPEGAHLNISGISGLAAKTSYAMFLLNALQQSSMKKEYDRSTAYIFLNVKGRDLLTIDEKVERLSSEEKGIYKTLGLGLEPFHNVTYFYPYSQFNDGYMSYVHRDVFKNQVKLNKAYTYKYTFKDDRENIDLLFSNVDDPQQTIESILNYIVTSKDFTELEDWEEFLKTVKGYCEAGKSGGKEISVMSWRKFKRIISKAIESNSMFSRACMENSRETRLEDKIKQIKKDDVFVIDIAKQDENMQAFIFGSVMQAVQKLKLGEFDNDSQVDKKAIPDRIVIFVDELNKYASNDVPKSSPILRLLLDIAERGRSLGIILFSAEQFKSAIHKRITGNCSTHAYGRTNSIELADKAYSFVPNTYKNIMTRLKQGEYIIQNPVFSSLLKIRFPQPLYKQDKGDSK